MDANKIVITRNNVFVGKWYANDGLFKLNVTPNLRNGFSPPTIMNVESCDYGMNIPQLWMKILVIMTREIVTCKFWIHKKKGEFEPDPES